MPMLSTTWLVDGGIYLMPSHRPADSWTTLGLHAPLTLDHFPVSQTRRSFLFCRKQPR